MDSKKQRHVYRLVKIEHRIEAIPLSLPQFEFVDYSDAWNMCITIFMHEKNVSGILIYSTTGTGIFLKRNGVGVKQCLDKRERVLKDPE